MVAPVKYFWGLVKYRPEIDPADLAAAIEFQDARRGIAPRQRDTIASPERYNPFNAGLAIPRERAEKNWFILFGEALPA
jgi:hypothetical protein